MAGIKRFRVKGWPQTIVSTVPALTRVAEQMGVVRYECPVQVFPGAGFSGTLAMRAAALDGHDEIYLVGFDGGNGGRFYHEKGGNDRAEFGSAYESLRDTIIEGFQSQKWFLFDGEEYIPYNRKCEIEEWAR
jgi:hypothetical protein